MEGSESQQHIENTLNEMNAAFRGTPQGSAVSFLRSKAADPAEAFMSTLMFLNLMDGKDFVALAPEMVGVLKQYKRDRYNKNLVSNTLRHIYLPLNPKSENIMAPTFLKTEAPEFLEWLDKKGFFKEFDEKYPVSKEGGKAYLQKQVEKFNKLSSEVLLETVDAVATRGEPQYIGMWSDAPGDRTLVDSASNVRSVTAGPLFYFFNTLYKWDLSIEGIDKEYMYRVVTHVLSLPEGERNVSHLLKAVNKLLSTVLVSHNGEDPKAFYNPDMGIVFKVIP